MIQNFRFNFNDELVNGWTGVGTQLNGIGMEAAQWLADQGIVAFGGDTWASEWK